MSAADELWVSGSPDGPWQRACDIGRGVPQSDAELFAWVDRLLARMQTSPIPALTLEWRDEQGRKNRMHLGDGQLRRLVELARGNGEEAT